MARAIYWLARLQSSGRQEVARYGLNQEVHVRNKESEVHQKKIAEVVYSDMGPTGLCVKLNDTSRQVKHETECLHIVLPG